MTVTYTDEMARNSSPEADSFVPRYARANRTKKGLRTWMILAPIGALALVGGGAAMIMGGGSETQPLVEPEPVSPMVQPMATAQVPLESSVAPAALTVPTSTPAPVIRDAAPVRESTPSRPVVAERRAAPVERQAAAQPTVSPRVEAPGVEALPEPTGLRPYSASPAVATAPSPTVTPPAPSIQTAPLN